MLHLYFVATLLCVAKYSVHALSDIFYKGVCHASARHSIYLFKKLKLFSHQLNSKLCYLRLYVSIKTVSCRLLLRMARIYNDMKLKKFGQLSQVLIISGAPKENIVQNHINIALLNVL